MKKSQVFSQEGVAVIGVLNLTPDSFSDGGRFVDREDRVDVAAVLSAARRMVAEGADVLDLGGESTRPGAREVPAAREIARTRAVIEALAKSLDVPLSIDTRKAEVAEAALAAGACWVNDVSGLHHDPELAGVVARAEAGILLGHMRGTPATMQQEIHFEDVVAEVAGELRDAVERAQAAGIPLERIAVDPGIGFGKRLEHNLALLAEVGRLRERLGVPVVVGPSRKAFLGALTGDPAAERDAATQAACAVAVFAGADGIRVHDVAGGRRAARVARALREARRSAP